MSLISEALKKARQEAARQDSLRQGVPYAVGTVDPPQRSPLMPLFAGLGAGCLLAGLLFGVAWIAGMGPFAKKVPETRVAQAPAIPEPAATPQEAMPAPPEPVISEAVPPVSAPPPVAPTLVPEERPEPTEARPAPAVEPPAAVQVTPPPPAPVEAPVPAPPPVQIQPTPAPENTAGAEEEKVYVGEVPVPGGGSIKLNGIAFSQDQRIAVLDGRVVGPGEVVQGYTVVDIQANRVKLQGHGTTVFVTTK